MFKVFYAAGPSFNRSDSCFKILLPSTTKFSRVFEPGLLFLIPTKSEIRSKKDGGVSKLTTLASSVKRSNDPTIKDEFLEIFSRLSY